ncbi:MAG TPA: hypothetical protein VGK76_01450 [Candidatus Eisenbacteria bacterium]
MRFTLMLSLAVVVGCATAREIIALRQVEFRFDRIAGARVAGIPLARIRSYSDLTPIDVGRLGVAVASRDVPLDLTVHLEGRNPETNKVTARLVSMDWSYLVDDREAVSGHFPDALTFPPGEPRDVPLLVTFNLMDMFGDRRRDLIDVALALAGQRTSTHRVALRIEPTVETRFGRIRYPTPITIDLSRAPSR